MEKLKARLTEASTYAGIGLVIAGTGSIFKLDHASDVASLVTKAGGAISTGDFATGGMLMLTGLLAIFLKEKGSK